MCGVDYDEPRFYSERVVRARKQHRCCDCYRRIAPGTEYMRCSGMWDVYVSTHHRCLDCVELAEAVAALGCSWAFGNLHEDAKAAASPWGGHRHDPAGQGRVIGLLWRAHERAGLDR